MGTSQSAHLRLQQADTAEEWVKRGIAVVPTDSQLHFILSEVYQLQGHSDLAVEAMKEAVRLAPDELEFRYKLVRHYLGQRNNPAAQQEAVRHLQELHTRSPVKYCGVVEISTRVVGTRTIGGCREPLSGIKTPFRRYRPRKTCISHTRDSCNKARRPETRFTKYPNFRELTPSKSRAISKASANW